MKNNLALEGKSLKILNHPLDIHFYNDKSSILNSIMLKIKISILHKFSGSRIHQVQENDLAVTRGLF